MLELTVQQIRVDGPWQYDGKTIELTGTFDECISYTCKICDASEPVDPYVRENRQTCLGVNFLHPTLEQLARFSTVTVQGRYSATCSGVQQTPNAREITVCTDRAAELSDAIVVDIVTPRTSIEGRISSYGDATLLSPSPDDEAALKSAFTSSLSSFAHISDEQVYFSFIEEKYDDERLEEGDYGFYPVGGVCVCANEDTSTCATPTLSGHTYYQSAKYRNYACYSAEKRNGNWHFHPSD